MKPICQLLATILNAMLFANVDASEKISLPTSSGRTRADIYIERCQEKARGTLVLCPGRNGNGQGLIDNPAWIDFARKEKLNMVGLSFASNQSAENRGYFVVSSGSGLALDDCLRREFGPDQPLLLLYGFSRGAQFAYSFARWKPAAVLAWCAYSATDWEVSMEGSAGPRGIIACGEEDELNYSFSMLQFLKGRSEQKPWTWVSLGHTGHTWSTSLDEFVRVYFASILRNPNANGLWLDVDTKSSIGASDLKAHPTLATWLPDQLAAQTWKDLHQP